MVFTKNFRSNTNKYWYSTRAEVITRHNRGLFLSWSSHSLDERKGMDESLLEGRWAGMAVSVVFLVAGSYASWLLFLFHSSMDASKSLALPISFAPSQKCCADSTCRIGFPSCRGFYSRTVFFDHRNCTSGSCGSPFVFLFLWVLYQHVGTYRFWILDRWPSPKTFVANTKYSDSSLSPPHEPSN